MAMVIKFMSKPKTSAGLQQPKKAFKEKLAAQVSDNPKAALPQNINKQGLIWLLEDLEAAWDGYLKEAWFFKHIITNFPGWAVEEQQHSGMPVSFWCRYSFWVGMFYLKAVGLIDFERTPSFKEIVSNRGLTARVVKSINFVGDYDTLRKTWNAHEGIIRNAAPNVWWLVKWPLRDKLVEQYNELCPSFKRLGLSRYKPKLRVPRDLI